jgi:hypothetical protein
MDFWSGYPSPENYGKVMGGDIGARRKHSLVCPVGIGRAVKRTYFFGALIVSLSLNARANSILLVEPLALDKNIYRMPVGKPASAIKVFPIDEKKKRGKDNTADNNGQSLPGGFHQVIRYFVPCLEHQCTPVRFSLSYCPDSLELCGGFDRSCVRTGRYGIPIFLPKSP